MARTLKRFALDQLVKVLDRVPIVSSIKNDLTRLRSLLYDRRPPRIVALGLPSSGRSSLLRSLVQRGAAQDALHAEHGQWVHIEHVGAKIDWMEVDVDAPDVQARWEAALDQHTPDLVLLMVEPSKLPRASEILDRCRPLLRSLPPGESKTRIFPLLTHCDLIGTDEGDIESARRQLASAIRASSIQADPPRTVSAISEHGLTGLSEAIVSALPDEAQIETARALTRAKQARIRIGNEIVQTCTAISVTIGVTPIPFSDMVVLGPLQAMMVSALAYLSGRTLGPRTVAEWIAGLGIVGGMGMGLRFAAQTVAKFIPGAGNAISAGVAGAGTTAMGQSAVQYFLRTGPSSG